MSGDQSEKTEEATPKRRREAREKGQVLKSKEVNMAALVLVGAYCLSWFGFYIYKTLFRYFSQTYSEIPWSIPTEALADQMMLRAVLVMFMILAPIFLAVYVTAALVELLQVGVLFTLKPLKAQLERINPIKGFKRIFALKSLVELTKSIIKTLIIGWFVFDTIRDNIPYVLATLSEPPLASLSITGTLVILIAKKVAAAMVAIAFIDYFYQRYEFEKSLRMSKQEVKDEYKQTEGDPHIKGKQRQVMRQMSRGQMRQAVPDATAVVTNPTHYAIALKYKKDMEAPTIVAKGEDYMAHVIKEIAAEHDIPIFEDKELARALYRFAEVDKPIPPEFFMAVAQIVAQIMKDQKKAQQRKVDQARAQYRNRRMLNSVTPPAKTPPAQPPPAPGPAG